MAVGGIRWAVGRAEAADILYLYTIVLLFEMTIVCYCVFSCMQMCASV